VLSFSAVRRHGEGEGRKGGRGEGRGAEGTTEKKPGSAQKQGVQGCSEDSLGIFKVWYTLRRRPLCTP